MLEITKNGQVEIVSFKELTKLNALVSEEVKEQMLQLFETPSAKVILDLKGISYIDSSGFGVFLSVMKAANNNYGAFKICNVSDDVMNMFHILQLHSVFEIFDDSEACLQSFI